MRELNSVECVVAAGGVVSNDIVYVSEVFAPPTPEQQLVLLMSLGALCGGFGGLMMGMKAGFGSVALAGTAFAGATAGLFVFPFIGFGMANLIANGFNSVKSYYI
jgi:hypothetical protein